MWKSPIPRSKARHCGFLLWEKNYWHFRCNLKTSKKYESDFYKCFIVKIVHLGFLEQLPNMPKTLMKNKYGWGIYRLALFLLTGTHRVPVVCLWWWERVGTKCSQQIKAIRRNPYCIACQWYIPRKPFHCRGNSTMITSGRCFIVVGCSLYSNHHSPYVDS